MKTLFPSHLRTLLRENIRLAPYSTFQIGGPADLFAEPENTEDFIELITTVQKNAIPSFILGGGSNTLFHENGFRGIVIHPIFKKITIEENRITAEAGVLLSHLVQKTIENNLEGIEGWVGLPGTFGGAIRGNAGANGVEVKDVLTHATLFDLQTGEKKSYKNSELHFGYRHSLLKENRQLFILEGMIELKKIENNAELRARMTDILKKRNMTQPKGKSAGCVFKNPAPGISAGRLIDECGCKGLKKGGIEISAIHGNFFLNHGKASQKDVLDLIRTAQEKVKQEKGYDLETEIEIVPEK